METELKVHEYLLYSTCEHLRFDIELTLFVLGSAFEAWHVNVMQLPETVRSPERS